MVVGILNWSPHLSFHINSALSHLALVANQPNWSSTEEIDVPIRQRHLCKAIDQAHFNSFLNDAPDTRSKALALIVDLYTPRK